MKKTRVLQFICPSGFYGAEMWILALAKNFNPESVECSLAVTCESEKQNNELYARFQVLGLSAQQIRMRGRFDPTVLLGLCRLIKDKGIDIIHTHGYKSDILGLIAARMTGIRCVATPHGFENAPNRKLQLFIRLGCMALKHFDRVAPLSDELMRDMQRIAVNPSRIRVIINGVDLDEVEAEKRETHPPLYADFPGKKIGYIGQLAHRKNAGDLIRAFDLLHKKHKDCCLFLVGDGPKRAELEGLAETLPFSADIHFLGYRKDRMRILKELNVFSMTSSLEGIPRCMMEAMAMGIPVAAYNIPGVDKLIIPEETGLLAVYGDTASLADCWDRLLSDPNLAARLADNAQKYVFEKFSAHRMATEYTDLYAQMTYRASF